MAETNPFPGMNPYLERHWRDVHHRLIQYACDQISEQLPGRLRARVEERVFLEDSDGWTRNIYPDVRIIERKPGSILPGTGLEAEAASGGVAIEEPLVLRFHNDPITEGFIEIRDGESGNRVITVIEILSPANKAGGAGTAAYKEKQREVEAGDASLVEIDLLRAGQRVTLVPWEQIPRSHRTIYHTQVHRGWRAGEAEIYRMPLQRRLPPLRIPLRQTDPDARLDLQALIDQAYRMGRYDDIDYRQEPEPPLTAEDGAWANELLTHGPTVSGALRWTYGTPLSLNECAIGSEVGIYP